MITDFSILSIDDNNNQWSMTTMAWLEILFVPKQFMTFDYEELLIAESFRSSTMKSLEIVNHLFDTAILFKYTFHIFRNYREHFSWHEQNYTCSSTRKCKGNVTRLFLASSMQ